MIVRIVSQITHEPEEVIAITRMTAKEFHEAHHPGLVDLMLNPEKELAEDTSKAHLVAMRLGCQRNQTGRYPLGVWEIACPE